MSPADLLAAERLHLPALIELLAAAAGADAASVRLLDGSALKPDVHRVRYEADGEERSAVLKRTTPAIARRNRLVSDAWLPEAGLADLAPATHGILTTPEPDVVWLVSEDVGARTLADAPRRAARAAAAAARLAELHTRFAGHAVLGEVRLHGGDLGPAFLLGNLRDAIGALSALARERVDASGPRAAARGRLLDRLHALLDEAPRRIEVLLRAGGPETLLHGDLWLENLVEPPRVGPARRDPHGTPGTRGTQRDVRLIDWDHAAVGPPLYDVSTLLYRFPHAERRALWTLYVGALGVGAWQLPDEPELALLCETCEHARLANRVIWPALEALRGGGEHALVELDEVAGWFDALEPLLP